MAAITKEERQQLEALGVQVPAPKSGRGETELRRSTDYEDLEPFELQCKCPYCDKQVSFTNDDGEGDMDCPHCGKGIHLAWGDAIATVEISVTLSPRVTPTDRKYLEWRKTGSAA